MALSYSNIIRSPIGNKFLVSGVVTFDSSYASGGEVVDPAAIGLHTIENMIVSGAEGYQCCFTPADSKIHVYAGTGGGTPAGSIAISPHADSAGTPAGSIVISPHADSAGTPAGTNAASAVQAQMFDIDDEGVTIPTITLTHNADPAGAGLSAAPLYAVVNTAPYFGQARLESNQASTADTTFSTSNDGAFYNTGTQRAYGFVKHDATPGGVQIYVDEADSDKLKANFTAGGNAGHKYVPLKMGFVTIWLKIFDADTAGMKALYYDDDGADDAKLVFVDTGAAGGVVHATNLFKGCALGLMPTLGSQSGVAEGQVFTGAAMGDHSHASTAAFTGSALGDHSHASTATFTGSGMAVGATAEVAGTTDLSALNTVVFAAIGF